MLWVTHGVPVYLAILARLPGARSAVGLFNAFFTAVVKIPSFIATLGSSTLVFGLTLYIGQTQNLSYQYPPTGHTVPHERVPASSRTSATPRFPGKFPEQGVWTIALLLVFGFLLSRTLFGFRLKAIGGNRAGGRDRTAARSQRYIFLAFILCACMACLAGLLDFSFVGSAEPERRPVRPVPGVRRGDHRRREPHRRQGQRRSGRSAARSCSPCSPTASR